jgi:acetyl-CoA C-acetyltransferase
LKHADTPRACSLATASHWPTEGAHGETFVSLNGYLMAEYMRRYNRPHLDFAPFAITAHDNAATAPHAVFNKKRLDRDLFEAAQTITGPVQVCLARMKLFTIF